jgi:hypothetical protein
VSTLLTVRSKLRKGDGCSIFRDKGEKKTSYFWLKGLSDGLNSLTSFLSQFSSMFAARIRRLPGILSDIVAYEE